MHRRAEKKDFPMGQKGSSNMRMEWELGRGEFSNVTCDINMIYDKTRFPPKARLLKCLSSETTAGISALRRGEK